MNMGARLRILFQVQGALLQVASVGAHNRELRARSGLRVTPLLKGVLSPDAAERVRRVRTLATFVTKWMKQWLLMRPKSAWSIVATYGVERMSVRSNVVFRAEEMLWRAYL